MGPILTIKKYPNRRLYDSEQSRYITMDELGSIIRGGRDVRVLDAKTDEDLTQPTLVQLLVEGERAHLLPAPLLMQLVRMGDDALAEFYGRYMTWALELYFAVKQRATSSFNPFAQMPFDMGGAIARMFMGGASPAPSAPPWSAPGAIPTPAPPPPPEPHSPPPEAPTASGDIAALRRELESLKKSLKSAVKKPRARTRS